MNLHTNINISRNLYPKILIYLGTCILISKVLISLRALAENENILMLMEAIKKVNKRSILTLEIKLCQ